MHWISPSRFEGFTFVRKNLSPRSEEPINQVEAPFDLPTEPERVVAEEPSIAVDEAPEFEIEHPAELAIELETVADATTNRQRCCRHFIEPVADYEHPEDVTAEPVAPAEPALVSEDPGEAVTAEIESPADEVAPVLPDAAVAAPAEASAADIPLDPFRGMENDIGLVPRRDALAADD